MIMKKIKQKPKQQELLHQTISWKLNAIYRMITRKLYVNLGYPPV